MGKPLKNPRDYPLFVFRISDEEKRDLIKVIARAKQLTNKSRSPGEAITKKNQIIIAALKVGLNSIIKRGAL